MTYFFISATKNKRNIVSVISLLTNAEKNSVILFAWASLCNLFSVVGEREVIFQKDCNEITYLLEEEPSNNCFFRKKHLIEYLWEFEYHFLGKTFIPFSKIVLWLKCKKNLKC